MRKRGSRGKENEGGCRVIGKRSDTPEIPLCQWPLDDDLYGGNVLTTPSNVKREWPSRRGGSILFFPEKLTIRLQIGQFRAPSMTRAEKY